MFVYQPTLNKLELKKDKGFGYFLSWKSNGVYNSKLKLLHSAFVYSIKLSGYQIGIKFDKDPLAVEENNYWTKIFYIFHNLHAWPKFRLDILH